MHLQLLSDSCTTGWAHWGHGELWLTPDSIVRIPKLSLTLAAVGRGALAGVGAGASGAVVREIGRASSGCRELDVDPVDWSLYLAAHPAHLRIDVEDVVSASIRTGILTSRLRLEIAGAPQVKLLWMRSTVAVRALRAVLDPKLA